jgi:tRNA(Ile)-lysidine synthase TilS/MesJ
MSEVESNPMKVTTTQGDVVIDITTVKRHHPSTWFEPVRKVGIRLSGGADSAIVAYMLALYKRDYRPDIVLHAITCVNDTKPYQEIYAKRVLEKITDLTGVEFGEHFVKDIDGSDYIGSFADGFPVPKTARYIQLLGVAGGSVNLMFDIDV